MTNLDKARRYEVAIVGGGLIGSTLALALGRAGLSVALIERASPTALLDDAFDGRTTAVAASSQTVLAGIGAWDELAPLAGPILDIRISDGASRLHLHYDHAAVGDRPLGYIVENRHLRRALFQALATVDTVTIVAPTSVAAIVRDNAAAKLTLDDGSEIAAQLVIGTDGRNSTVRRSADIGSVTWGYDQTSLVTLVRHDEPHRSIAHERFLTGGPFALLPMADSHVSSVVWSDETSLIHRMIALDDAKLAVELVERFGPWLGTFKIVAPRSEWKLSLHHAKSYVAPRLALAGDAAHGIHPIAGQGANLGWRDVAALAEVLVDARRLGLDIGALDVLRRYEAWRRPDNIALTAATDGLNRLFSNDVAPVRLARDLGLAAVQKIGPLKQIFMRHAMGLAGDQPRLARGERL